MLAALLLAIFASLCLLCATIGRRMAGQAPTLSPTILFASLIFFAHGLGKTGQGYSPGWLILLTKRGHYYFAQNRTFLLCLDSLCFFPKTDIGFWASPNSAFLAEKTILYRHNCFKKAKYFIK